jgi:hypothetical protein
VFLCLSAGGDIPEIDDVSEVAGTGAPMPDGEPSEDWDDKNKYANNPDKQKKNFTKQPTVNKTNIYNLIIFLIFIYKIIKISPR